MVILIAGASHTGKTLLAQKLLEKWHYPYLSIDHLKMGLIRSSQTDLTPLDDDELTDYLWPIVREMINTVVENKQNLIVEGCYIPFSWQEDFPEAYRQEIRCRYLIMTSEYIRTHFAAIQANANMIETRLDDSWLTPEDLIQENVQNLELCRSHNCDVYLLDKEYDLDPERFCEGWDMRQVNLL